MYLDVIREPIDYLKIRLSLHFNKRYIYNVQLVYKGQSLTSRHDIIKYAISYNDLRRKSYNFVLLDQSCNSWQKYIKLCMYKIIQKLKKILYHSICFSNNHISIRSKQRLIASLFIYSFLHLTIKGAFVHW